ncbi:DUF1593 domain-containing protein [Rhodocytophaga aerolata]|uniref:DUF1593 domain-containing protein n=1 Tax=Rhodocytophaga aerolata TaxID=455078 RepID=A0ABT8R8B0_9BACT|nr:nucleoside hydrolase-like domain-containing protein [Rhodocytophaga aerolata]MDO1447926.1 DUF1593 domain-containing protein [Rhodocytophaga aerolata]
MHLQKLLLFCCCWLLSINLMGQEKYRVVIMTDMTHDDGNSLIRYLYYTPYFDTEAIIVTQQLPDFNYNQDGPWNKVQSILSAYKQEYNQLKKHDAQFPTYEKLAGITKKGRGALPILWLTNEKKFAGKIAERYVESSWGDIRFADWIGEGNTPNGETKDSEGSEFLQQVFDKPDNRPIFVQMWGGPVTFMQALYRYRQRQGEEKYQQLLSKLHVFSIHLQDITFDYMLDLDKMQDTKCLNMGTVRSTYEGERVQPGWFLYDGNHFWKYIRVMKQTEVNGHGPMSDLYDHGGEGDTPAFLYLLSARFGLNNPLKPTQGSWGSRFVPMSEAFPGNYFHTCQVEQAELERWIPHVKNNFLNRLKYSTKDPKQVNHEPIAQVNKDKTTKILSIKTKPGASVNLNASSSTDPDGNKLSFKWYQYKTHNSYTGDISLANPAAALQTVTLPQDIGDKSLHLILEVHDNGTPSLVTYRRILLSAE